MTKTGPKYSVIAVVTLLLLISGVFHSVVHAQVYTPYAAGYSDPYAASYYSAYTGYAGGAYSQYQYPSYSYPTYYSNNYSYPSTYSQSYPAYNNGWTSSYSQPTYSQYQYPQYQNQYQTPSYQYQYPSYPYPTYQYPQSYDLPLTVSCAPTLSTIEVGNPVTWSASAYGGVGSSPYSSGHNYTFAWTGESIVPRNANLATAYYLSPGVKTATVTVYSDGQTATQNCGTVFVSGRYIPSLWGAY